MAWTKAPETSTEGQQKAEYNQSFGITEILVNLMGSYAANMFENNLTKTMEVLGVILDVISPKLKPAELTEADEMTNHILNNLQYASETFTNEGRTYLQNPKLHEITKLEVRKLYRYIAKLQDKHGYGMKDLDDEINDFFKYT